MSGQPIDPTRPCGEEASEEGDTGDDRPETGRSLRWGPAARDSDERDDAVIDLTDGATGGRWGPRDEGEDAAPDDTLADAGSRPPRWGRRRRQQER